MLLFMHISCAFMYSVTTAIIAYLSKAAYSVMFKHLHGLVYDLSLSIFVPQFPIVFATPLI